MHNEVEHITWYKGFSFPFRYKYLDPISTNYKIDILDTLVLIGSEILNRLWKYWTTGLMHGFRNSDLYIYPEKNNYKIDILDTLVLKGSEILTPLLSRFAFLAKFCRIGILQGSEILTLIFIRKNQL